MARFNREGLAALDPRHGGGHAPTYDTAARDRILREAARTPAPETDGTSTWCTGPATLRDHIVPIINQAAADAGRPAPRVIAALPVNVTTDVDGTKRRTAEQLVVYNTLPSYRSMMDKEGVEGPADLTIAGSEAEVRDRLLELKGLGVTDFNAVLVAGNPEEKAQTLSVLRSVG